MKKIHKKLLKKSKAYKKWHKDPNHKARHWAILVFVGLLTTGYLLGVIKLTYNAHAATDIFINPSEVNTSQPYYLDQAGANYILNGDITFSGTGFVLIAQNVTLDLNGHKVTYDNAQPITVPNGDFENTSGWDFSTAPNGQRAAGSYIKPVSLFSGSYAAKFNLPAVDQSIRSVSPVTLEPSTTYRLSAMIYNQADTNATVYVQFDGTTIKASRTGFTWRGFQYTYAEFTTGPSVPTNYNIVAGISGASAGSGSLFIDDIRVQKTRIMGAAIGPASWESSRPSDVVRYGSATGAIIKNGEIIQGGHLSDRAHAIYTGSNNHNVEIANNTITVYGTDSFGITASDGDNYPNIHDNIINHNIRALSSRDNYTGEPINWTGSPIALGGKIYNNTINSSIHAGIRSGGTASSPFEVYGNNITIQSKYTNDFAISGGVSMIHDNVINCGSGNNSCRGIMPRTGSKVYNNIVSVQELSRNQEYNGCEAGGGYGIQIEYASDVEVFNNTVTATTGPDNCEADAFRTNPNDEVPAGGTGGRNNYVHDNIFIAQRQGGATAVASTIKVSGINSFDTLRFENNIIQTDGQWVFATGGNSNINLENNTLKLGSNVATPFRPLYTYDWNAPSSSVQNFHFIDNQYADSSVKSQFESASWVCQLINFGGACAVSSSSPIDRYSDFNNDWKLTIQVKDGSTNPLANANVVITDTNNTNVFSGTSDSDGLVSVVLSQFKNTAGVVNQYNPYTVDVSSGSDSASQSVVMDAAKTITLTLSSTTTPPPPPPTQDTIAPTVDSFDVNPKTVDSGSMVNITFSVSDTGGSYLNRVEVKRAPFVPGTCDDSTKTSCQWDNLETINAPASSNSWTSSTTDNPTVTSFYGIHAIDNAENRGYEPAIVKVNVNGLDTTPPIVNISYPGNGMTVPRLKTLNITAVADDDSGISKVEFYINGNLRCTDTTQTYSCDYKVPGAKGKVYRIQAIAYDTYGNMGVSTIVSVTAQ